MDQTKLEPSIVRRGLSITQKLVLLIVLTTGTIVLFLGSYFPDQQIQASRAELEKKAATYGRLVAYQVTSAIAFDDKATAREVFESVAKDPDVLSMALLTSRGVSLHTYGQQGAWAEQAKSGVQEQKVMNVGDRVVVLSPVVSLEGPRGTLLIELSTTALDAAKRRITKTAIVAGSISLAIGALLAFLIARSLGRRVGAIARVASAVAAGDLDQKPADVGGTDEVSVLASAFNAMLTQIRSLVTTITQSAQQEQERLNTLVSERTGELDRRNLDMRLILDHVSQGFISVDLQGRMSPERSAIVETWFGKADENASLFDYMDRRFPGKGQSFRMNWDNLLEEWMPLELRLDQLPSALESQGRHFGFAYNPVFDGETLNKILVVVSDLTAVVERQRAEEEGHEMVQAVRCLMTDRSGFLGFLAEAEELVLAIYADEGDRTLRMRLVHTLKGNSAIFGFASVARLCHALEDRMVECGEDLPLADRQRLRATWTRLSDRLSPFVSGRRNDAIDVHRKDYQKIVSEVASRARHSLIGSLLGSWELEPTEGRLQRTAEYASGLAERLQKLPLELKVEHNEVRLDPEEWTPLWQGLVHVVRNAVDHGLDTAEERAAAGKTEPAQITLRSRIVHGQLVVEVEDNGRGIDWVRVAEVARKKSLPASTQEELTSALFSDDLSTREHTTDTSGRGVGLSAVQQMCSETGGSISIESKRGQGTIFRFVWRVDARGRRLAPSDNQQRTGTDGA